LHLYLQWTGKGGNFGPATQPTLMGCWAQGFIFPFRGCTSHSDDVPIIIFRLLCMYVYHVVCKGVPKFHGSYFMYYDNSRKPTTHVHSISHCRGKKDVYVLFCPLLLTIRTKKQSTCRVILHLITALKLPRKETCLQRYVHIEEGEQAMSFPVKHGNSQCV